jgi:capsular exopolysaccharide synthesis family protein
MSRIEEALRRVGASRIAAPENEESVAAGRSPWTFPTEPVVRPEMPSPVIGPSTLLSDERTLPLTGFSREWAGRLATSPDVSPMLVEQFRRLAATLYHAQTAGHLKVVMVTSAWAGDGKTMTALNLALVLSESYRRRVLLIDADLRRPSISNLSEVAPTCGLSEGLKSKSDQKLSVVKITEMLTLLPAGRPDPDPMSSLTSDRMRRIIDEASSRFDWVILDAPPVGPVADANLLAAMTDAVLLVVRANQTQYAAVQKAVELLGRDKIFGVVLNAIDEVDQSQYGGHYGEYAALSRAGA